MCVKLNMVFLLDHWKFTNVVSVIIVSWIYLDKTPVVEPPHHSLSELSKESSKATTGDETPIDAKRYPNDSKQP